MSCEMRSEASKTNLGEKTIDVFSLARPNPTVPKEQLINQLVALKEKGWFNQVGASEMNAISLDIVHKITTIAVIEIEVSPTSFEPDIQAVIAWFQSNAVPVLCYSPFAVSSPGNTLTQTTSPPNNAKRHFPRFQGEAFYQNVKIVHESQEFGEEERGESDPTSFGWVDTYQPHIASRSQARSNRIE